MSDVALAGLVFGLSLDLLKELVGPPLHQGGDWSVCGLGDASGDVRVELLHHFLHGLQQCLYGSFCSVCSLHLTDGPLSTDHQEPSVFKCLILHGFIHFVSQGHHSQPHFQFGHGRCPTCKSHQVTAPINRTDPYLTSPGYSASFPPS